MGIVTTEYAEKLMKRCQIGTRNYNEANDLHAECYGTIGALVQERDTLRTGDTCAGQCEGAAYRIEPRRHRKERAMIYSKEPWKFVSAENPLDHEMDFFITDASGINQVCRAALSEHNARRIVACVNACAGISDEALDSWMNPPEGGFGHPHGPWPAHIISLHRAAETLKQQRDELLAAIEATLNENGHLADGDNCTLIALKRALAKVGAGGTAPEGHNGALTRGAKVVETSDGLNPSS